MNIIKNIIIIACKNDDEDYLIVNGLNGLVDVVNKTESLIIKKWINDGVITHDTEKEKLLLANLVKRNYIVENESVEAEIKQNLISKLKKDLKEREDNFKNAYFVLTYGCNFNCPYCYEKEIRRNKVITETFVDRVFELYHGVIENIGFFGGEPLLLTNKKIIEYIINKAPDANYSIITNGYYLEEYFPLFQNLNILNIQVTLDGPREVHNKTRTLCNGRGTYDKILSGIKLYAEHNIPITIRMNISKENYHDCLVEKEKLENIAWGKSLRFEMQPIFQNLAKEKNELYDALITKDVDAYNKNVILQRLKPISNFLYNLVPLKPILKACDAEYRSRFFDPDGDMYSCILGVGDKSKRIGTYYPELTYEEKSFIKRDITTIPACKECNNAFLCGGGCPNGVPSTCDILTTPNCYSFVEEVEYMVPCIYNLKFGKGK